MGILNLKGNDFMYEEAAEKIICRGDCNELT